MVKRTGIAVRSVWALAILSSFALQVLAAEAPTVPPSLSLPENRESGIRGKVLFEGKPAADVWMHVYQDASADFKGQGLAVFGPTAKDGLFSLNLKPGRYFLLGKGAGSASDGADPGVKELFGYYGGNPVKVSATSFVEVNLQVIRREPVTITRGEGPNVTIAGLVTGPRGPVEKATLFAYPDSRSDFRGPDLMGPQGSFTGGTGPDGRFYLELPPGAYYLTAAWRKGGAALGPLQVGDLFGYFDGNPLRLQAGQNAAITVQVTEKLRQAESSVATPGATGVRGRILDPSGKPVAGVFAFATTDPNLIGTMPPYHSRPVGPEGDFFIELPGGGTFYIGARTGFGGPPQPGQWQGMLGDANIRSVTIDGGKILDGVDITVRIVE